MISFLQNSIIYFCCRLLILWRDWSCSIINTCPTSFTMDQFLIWASSVSLRANWSRSLSISSHFLMWCRILSRATWQKSTSICKLMLITYLNCNWNTWVVRITSCWSTLWFSILGFLKWSSVFRLIIQGRQIFTMLNNKRTFMIRSKFLRIDIVILLIINVILLLHLLLDLRLLLLLSLICWIAFLLLNIYIVFRRCSFLFSLHH